MKIIEHLPSAFQSENNHLPWPLSQRVPVSLFPTAVSRNAVSSGSRWLGGGSPRYGRTNEAKVTVTVVTWCFPRFVCPGIHFLRGNSIACIKCSSESDLKLKVQVPKFFSLIKSYLLVRLWPSAPENGKKWKKIYPKIITNRSLPLASQHSPSDPWASQHSLSITPVDNKRPWHLQRSYPEWGATVFSGHPPGKQKAVFWCVFDVFPI